MSGCASTGIKVQIEEQRSAACIGRVGGRSTARVSGAWYRTAAQDERSLGSCE